MENLLRNILLFLELCPVTVYTEGPKIRILKRVGFNFIVFRTMKNNIVNIFLFILTMPLFSSCRSDKSILSYNNEYKLACNKVLSNVRVIDINSYLITNNLKSCDTLWTIEKEKSVIVGSLLNNETSKKYYNNRDINSLDRKRTRLNSRHIQ